MELAQQQRDDNNRFTPEFWSSIPRQSAAVSTRESCLELVDLVVDQVVDLRVKGSGHALPGGELVDNRVGRGVEGGVGLVANLLLGGAVEGEPGQLCISKSGDTMLCAVGWRLLLESKGGRVCLLGLRLGYILLAVDVLLKLLDVVAETHCD